MFDLPFDKEEPIFVNEIGTEFWIDKDLTDYARRKELIGVVVYFVRTKEGEKTRLIVKDNQPIYENTSYEGIAVFIDVIGKMEE